MWLDLDIIKVTLVVLGYIRIMLKATENDIGLYVRA
jgi:hypothetical protein